MSCCRPDVHELNISAFGAFESFWPVVVWLFPKRKGSTYVGPFRVVVMDFALQRNGRHKVLFPEPNQPTTLLSNILNLQPSE